MTIQREYIRDAFRGAQGEVRFCYERLLQDYPEATDRLVMEVAFTVEEDDQETATAELLSIESSDWQIDDLSCFADAIDGIEIPLVEGVRAGEQTIIHYPFQFSASP